LLLNSSCLVTSGSTKVIGRKEEGSIGLLSVASLEVESFLDGDGGDGDGEN